MDVSFYAVRRYFCGANITYLNTLNKWHIEIQNASKVTERKSEREKMFDEVLVNADIRE